MEDDWDLQAVVRGCSSSTSAATTSTTTSTSSFFTNKTTNWSFSGQQSTTFQLPAIQGDFFMGFPDLFQPRRSDSNSIEELLNNFYRPSFFTKSTKLPLSPPQLPLPVLPLSVLGGLQDLSPLPLPPPSPQLQQQQQQQQLYLQKQQFQPKQRFGGSRSATAQNARSKKRKNQLKRVCQVPAEGLSSDMWSWRKYGQKPIKGSPYPRGYYRCSTSKGCLARKQVERNRSDPGMYILTYTGEHNHPIPTHRNSLAGSTRQKPTSSGEESNKPTCSPPVSPTDSLSPAPEKREDTVEDDDDDELGVSDMAMSDDFFDGLDELVPAGDCSSLDQLPASLLFPWLSNSATTTAAGSG